MTDPIQVLQHMLSRSESLGEDGRLMFRRQVDTLKEVLKQHQTPDAVGRFAGGHLLAIYDTLTANRMKEAIEMTIAVFATAFAEMYGVESASKEETKQ